jgi:hypothetical protein
LGGQARADMPWLVSPQATKQKPYILKTSIKENKMKNTLVWLALTLGSGSVFAQKAYEIVNYQGKTPEFSLKLKYADGYFEASELLLTDLKTKKNANFTLCDNGSEAPEQRKFCFTDRKGGVNAERYVILVILEEAHSPEKIRGTYFYKGKSLEFVLAKK